LETKKPRTSEEEEEEEEADFSTLPPASIHKEKKPKI
jgi:hypothetical protein